MVVSGARRPRSAVAAVLCLAGSLLAVGSAPAGGVAGEADNEATYSACVGPALESRGLVDVVGSFAEDAVNCLAHYRVTLGRTATTYDPGAPVLRWQMALFLARAAGPAGMELPADPADDFTDIGGVFESGREAINQMAELGVMPGLRETAFGPDLAVSRAQMALMLDSFLAAAEKDGGLGLGALGPDADELSDVAPDDDIFTDIDSVTRGEYSAIRRMFEVGVTRGTSNGRFSPRSFVTRAQMAVFITRMLAHTMARPAGITIQAAASETTTDGAVDLVVSVRNDDLTAAPDALVDVFSSTNPDDAFGSDGRCSSDDVSLVGGSGLCVIELGDRATDPSGDLEITAEGLTEAATLWAWTGERGDRYDADDTESSSVRIAVTKPGAKLRVTDDMPEGAVAAQFGDRVVFVLQVVDEDGNPVDRKDVSVTAEIAETVTSGGAGGASSSSSTTRSYKTDDSGRVELSFSQTDPRSGDAGDSGRLDLDISLVANSGLVLEDKTNLGRAGADGAEAEDAAAVWRDSASVPTTLTLSQAVSYVEASAAGSGASHAVTATLTDQFGDPVPRQKIHFISDDPLGVGEESEDALLESVRAALTGDRPWRAYGFRVLQQLAGESRYTRTTNRRGVASLTYTRDSDASVIETVRARLVRGADDAQRQNGDEPDLFSKEGLEVYWFEELSDGGSVSGRILVGDDERNRIVVGGADGGVTLVDYDSNDQYTGLGGLVTLADFERDLRGGAAHLTVPVYADSTGRVSSFKLAPEWARVDLSRVPVPTGTGQTFTSLNIGNVHYAVDGGTIVVGSWYENNYAGAVYVYDGVKDTTPTRLAAPSPQESTFTGSYIGGNWRNRPWYLNLPTSGGWFGYVVDIRGDTLVVGEPGRLSTRQIDYGASDPRTGNATDGAVYVYTRSGGDWTLDATLKAGGSTLQGTPHNKHAFEFGSAVAVSGNEKVIAVGAPRYITSTRVGGVYLYERPDSAVAGNWDDDNGAGSPRLAPAQTDLNAAGNSWLGEYTKNRELAVSEDGSTVVAGAGFFKSVSDGTQYEWGGAAYVYTAPAGGWAAAVYTPDAKLESPVPFYAERLGSSVAVSSDGGTVVVAANFRPNTMRRGKALVFERPDSTDDSGKWDDNPDPAAVLRAPDHPDAPSTCTAAGGPVLGCNIGEVFGQWVDISGDGGRILASRLYRTEGNLRGSTMLFTEPAGGWSTATAAAPPASVEFLGSEPNTGLGNRNHFDQSNGNIWAADNDESGNGFRILRLTSSS